MVQMNDVKMVYGNTEAAALNGITFTINEGEFVFLVGPSGSGKTTIIKLITGELSPTSGQITVNGFDMQGIKRRKLPKLRRTLGVIFQDFRLIDKMTVYENVAFAMRVVGASNKEIRRRVPQVLELVGLVDREKRYPAELSGGEQQRVCIARALINCPKLILADEPTGNLDEKNEKIVLDLFRQLHEQGTTIIVVTHDALVASCAQREIMLNHGVLVGEQWNDEEAKRAYEAAGGKPAFTGSAAEGAQNGGIAISFADPTKAAKTGDTDAANVAVAAGVADDTDVEPDVTKGEQA